MSRSTKWLASSGVTYQAIAPLSAASCCKVAENISRTGMDYDNLPRTLWGRLVTFGPHVDRGLTDIPSGAATRRFYVHQYVARARPKRPLGYESATRNRGAVARFDEVFERRMERQHGRVRRPSRLWADPQGKRAHGADALRETGARSVGLMAPRAVRPLLADTLCPGCLLP